MTDTERDELLIRLDESTKEIKNKLKTDYAHYFAANAPAHLANAQMLGEAVESKLLAV